MRWIPTLYDLNNEEPFFLGNFINIAIFSYSKFLFESQNIVHGDIKPDNLLVTATGTVKIGDFSVSQVFEVIKVWYGFHFFLSILVMCPRIAAGRLVNFQSTSTQIGNTINFTSPHLKNQCLKYTKYNRITQGWKSRKSGISRSGHFTD